MFPRILGYKRVSDIAEVDVMVFKGDSVSKSNWLQVDIFR